MRSDSFEKFEIGPWTIKWCIIESIKTRQKDWMVVWFLIRILHIDEIYKKLILLAHEIFLWSHETFLGSIPFTVTRLRFTKWLKVPCSQMSKERQGTQSHDCNIVTSHKFTIFQSCNITLRIWFDIVHWNSSNT